MSTIADRAEASLNFGYYGRPNYPERVGRIELNIPDEQQYILRCPLKVPGSDLRVPEELRWCQDFIDAGLEYQAKVIKVEQPYIYLTVRSGEVCSTTDDEFHVDGFSMKIKHTPEQNYVWTNNHPTEYVAFELVVPDDFDPLVHNFQYLIQDSMPNDVAIESLKSGVVYAMDPYIFHRRPIIARSIARTFLRLSMTPIPIDDKNNHINAAFGKITSDYDGVADFRDLLLRYSVS